MSFFIVLPVCFFILIVSLVILLCLCKKFYVNDWPEPSYRCCSAESEQSDGDWAYWDNCQECGLGEDDPSGRVRPSQPESSDLDSSSDDEKFGEQRRESLDDQDALPSSVPGIIVFPIQECPVRNTVVLEQSTNFTIRHNPPWPERDSSAGCFTSTSSLTLSTCNECIGDGCDFNSDNEYSKAIMTLTEQRGEGLYDALISIFRISDQTKEKIDENSCSIVIKCIDLLHRVYHYQSKEILTEHQDLVTVLTKKLDMYDAQ